MIDYLISERCFTCDSPRFASSFLEKLPGVKWNKGLAYIPASIYNAQVLNKEIAPGGWSGPAQSMRDALLCDALKIHMAVKGHSLPLNHENLPSPFPLFTHQVQAIYGLASMEHRGILADEMGLGKTQVAITCYRCCVEQPLLVVCPASIKWKWQNDLKANGIDSYVIESVKELPGSFCKLTSSDKTYTNQYARIVNYDLLSRRPELVLDLAKFVKDGFLILDESHYVKDSGSKRTKACQKFKPKHVLLLTGTPIRNTLVDLFSQLHIARPGIWRNKWEFEDRYQIRKEMFVGPRKFLKPVGTRNEAELASILETIQIRRLKKDVMNLPDKVHSVIPLDFDKRSREIYEKMAKKWLYDFSDLGGEIPILDNRAKTAMEAAMRLEQICQGFLGPVPLGLSDRLALSAPSPHEVIAGGWIFKENPKFAWLEELLEDLGQKKVVAFFRFNASLEACFGKFNRPEERKLYGHPLMMTGNTASNARPGLIQDFQTSRGDRLFFIQVKIAEGFDLTAAQDVVFWGRDWSPAVNSQAEDRVHRIGQTGTVNVYLPIIKDSIEEKLHERLCEKEGVAKMVLGDFRKAIEATV
jgi:SWI/SNF-related matrix-associated actin-dependent regulator of chromatin subfamily A-like protein 1